MNSPTTCYSRLSTFLIGKDQLIGIALILTFVIGLRGLTNTRSILIFIRFPTVEGLNS
jgi:hypothetical protein